VTADAWASRFFGRDDVVRQLAESQVPLTVLSGDSGIGKSEVLRAAQIATRDAITPPPLLLRRECGVLHSILLEGLGDVLALDVQLRDSGAEIDGRLRKAAERIFRQAGSALTQVVSRELLAFVRGRLGEEFGAATYEFIVALKAPADQSLAVRINNALEPTATDIVLKLAHEVLGDFDHEGAVLALDVGENLSSDAVRILGDLAEKLPENLRIRIAVSTYSAEKYQAIVAPLSASDRYFHEVQLLGIGEDGVCEWLEKEGLSGDMAKTVTRATSGNALDVGDVIARLKEGKPIYDSLVREDFAHRTDDAWMQLEPEVARHARRLCVCANPLPFDRTLDFLGLEPAEWGEVQERLRHARIFSVEVDGLHWFQEARRRHVRENKLEDSERALLRANAWRWFDGQLNQLFEDSSYSAWYALERREFQNLLVEWLYLMAFIDPLEAAEGLARIYLKALWWWGLYVSFDLCDRLVEMGARVVRHGDNAETGATQLDRVVDAIERLHRHYPREGRRFQDGGEVVGGEQDSWAETEAALREIADGTALVEGAGSSRAPRAGGEQRLAAQAEIAMLVHVFRAHCLRGLAENENKGMGEEELRELDNHYERAIDLADDDNDWDRAWFRYEWADGLTDPAAFGRAADTAAGNGRRQRARELLAEAGDYVKTRQQYNVEELDFELAANVERVEGDLLWGNDRCEDAASRYVRAVHYAHASQVWPPDSGPDPYTLTFYREQCLRFAMRIAKLASDEGGRAGQDKVLRAIVKHVAAFRGEEYNALWDRVAGCLSRRDDRALATLLGGHCPEAKDLAGDGKEDYSRKAVCRIRRIERLWPDLVTLPPRSDAERGR
jgi:hypothetical protein